jgi:hypothetical protein
MFYTLTVLTLLTGGLNARSLPKRATQTRRKQAYWGQKMVLTMGSTLADEVRRFGRQHDSGRYSEPAEDPAES